MNEYDIARVCHQANKALCEAYGDFSQVDWADAPEWQRESAAAGVRAVLADPTLTPQQLNAKWAADKYADGWVWGPTKDANLKTHPCLVPYGELPVEQRAKDYVFADIVKALGVKPLHKVQKAGK